ncbi:hypothetical protein HELRODRAFT_152254, partial [Helobdella robusta]|uniref:ENTH domain-containing protein n=1 Tax=Helobdella robusta TaxID=6412 RepID=T1EKQ2_HELRO
LMANKVTRKIKNVVKQYTFAEVKIREATSNDPGGPTPKQLDEIAELSYHAVAVVEILGIIWKRLSDGEKQWRHLYKSLIVLDHLVKCGSEKVALYSQEKIDLIKQLNNIDLYYDGYDVGTQISTKAKQLVSLLTDKDRLQNERTKMLAAKRTFAK